MYTNYRDKKVIRKGDRGYLIFNRAVEHECSHASIQMRACVTTRVD